MMKAQASTDSVSRRALPAGYSALSLQAAAASGAQAQLGGQGVCKPEPAAQAQRTCPSPSPPTQSRLATPGL